MSLPKKQKLTENEAENNNTITASQNLINIQNELCTLLGSLNFQLPIEFVYNPLIYAKDLHEKFVRKYFEQSSKKILFLGINPGPWGMCQTGICFGERDIVQNWFDIKGPVERPENEHPKRKVKGLDCHRKERSGKKFWEFFKILCNTPENFFKHSFVYNYCPLAFMNASGKNITPIEIKDKATKARLFEICDEAFIKIIAEFHFEMVISIGAFAEKKASRTLTSSGLTHVRVFKIPHPSPRNPKNVNWERDTFTILRNNDLIRYFSHPDFDGSIFGGDQNAPQ